MGQAWRLAQFCGTVFTGVNPETGRKVRYIVSQVLGSPSYHKKTQLRILVRRDSVHSREDPLVFTSYRQFERWLPKRLVEHELRETSKFEKKHAYLLSLWWHATSLAEGRGYTCMYSNKYFGISYCVPTIHSVEVRGESRVDINLKVAKRIDSHELWSFIDLLQYLKYPWNGRLPLFALTENEEAGKMLVPWHCP
jgi:hypothetical protein